MIFVFNEKRKAVEGHRLQIVTFVEYARLIRTCEIWFSQFKGGDLNIKDRTRCGRLWQCDVKEWLALLEEQKAQTHQLFAEALNVSQETTSRRLSAMWKIYTLFKWVPNNLKERKMENCKLAYDKLLQSHKRKSVLHQTMSGDKKWIYFESPKRRKSWRPQSKADPSTPRSNRFRKRNAFCLMGPEQCCVF